MINKHKISHKWENYHLSILGRFGIKVELGHDSFWIEENEEYFALKEYFDKWNVHETIISKFSIEEENASEYLIMLPPSSNGYPMPDDDFGYFKTTYNDTDHCRTCGMGLVQKEPFRIRKEPNWSGNKKIFSLNWVYDELFVRDVFYNETFKGKGMAKEKVLLYKKETVIESTVQLIIPSIDVSLNLEDYPFEVCKVCNRKRYDLINKGFFPSFKQELKGLHIFKSKEWFGTGANARKYIFVSQELRKELRKIKVNPIYIPCE